MTGVDAERNPRVAAELAILGARHSDRKVEPRVFVQEPDGALLRLAIGPQNRRDGVARRIEKCFDLRWIHSVACNGPEFLFYDPTRPAAQPIA
jgi:hypothetical protein